MCATAAAPSPIAPANPLHRARTHVTYRVYARHARFERSVRRAGEHEAVRVECNAAVLQPRGLGISADEDEYVANRSRRRRARPAVSPDDLTQPSFGISSKLRKLRAIRKLDYVGRGDPVDEIA